MILKKDGNLNQKPFNERKISNRAQDKYNKEMFSVNRGALLTKSLITIVLFWWLALIEFVIHMVKMGLAKNYVSQKMLKTSLRYMFSILFIYILYGILCFPSEEGILVSMSFFSGKTILVWLCSFPIIFYMSRLIVKKMWKNHTTWDIDVKNTKEIRDFGNDVIENRHNLLYLFAYSKVWKAILAPFVESNTSSMYYSHTMLYSPKGQDIRIPTSHNPGYIFRNGTRYKITTEKDF